MLFLLSFAFFLFSFSRTVHTGTCSHSFSLFSHRIAEYYFFFFSHSFPVTYPFKPEMAFIQKSTQFRSNYDPQTSAQHLRSLWTPRFVHWFYQYRSRGDKKVPCPLHCGISLKFSSVRNHIAYSRCPTVLQLHPADRSEIFLIWKQSNPRNAYSSRTVSRDSKKLRNDSRADDSEPEEHGTPFDAHLGCPTVSSVFVAPSSSAHRHEQYHELSEAEELILNIRDLIGFRWVKSSSTATAPNRLEYQVQWYNSDVPGWVSNSMLVSTSAVGAALARKGHRWRKAGKIPEILDSCAPQQQQQNHEYRDGKTGENDDEQQQLDSNDEDDNPLYEVESIIGRKIHKGVVHYLVKWKDYPEEEASWLPKKDLSGCLDAIRDYLDSHRTAPDNSKTRVRPSRRNFSPVTANLRWDDISSFEEIKMLEKLINSNAPPSAHARLKSAVLLMVRYQMNNHPSQPKSLEQYFAQIGLRLSYLSWETHHDFWKWWMDEAIQKNRAKSTIRNQADMMEKIVQFFSIMTNNMREPVRDWQSIINFYHNHSAALNRQEMRARKVRNSITSQRRDEVIMEEDDFKLVANHVSEVLDATRAKVSLRKIEARKKQKKQQKKSNSKRKQTRNDSTKKRNDSHSKTNNSKAMDKEPSGLFLSREEARSARDCLLWKLTVALGCPRTNEQFVQWQLNTNLLLETDNAKRVDWKDFSRHNDNFWRFFPEKIKCPEHKGRQDNSFAPVCIPQELNPDMRFYLKYVRPVLLCQDDGTIVDDHLYFWVNLDGSQITGVQRRRLTKSLLRSVLGREFNINQIRKSLGTLLENDKSLTPEQRLAGIHQMGHTELTHLHFYVMPNEESLISDTHVHPTFASLSC